MLGGCPIVGCNSLPPGRAKGRRPLTGSHHPHHPHSTPVGGGALGEECSLGTAPRLGYPHQEFCALSPPPRGRGLPARLNHWP